MKWNSLYSKMYLNKPLGFPNYEDDDYEDSYFRNQVTVLKDDKASNPVTEINGDDDDE